MKVEDVLELNRAVEQLKADAGLALRIQPIKEERLRWGVISLMGECKERKDSGRAHADSI